MRRSRFQTEIAHAPSVEEARAFVDRIRADDPGATHHCWAFLVGPPGSTARVGFSDDGEPHGTAGQPMLTALLHGGVGDVVAVCTRHYGGVKLGTGGLARAYGGGVKQALEELVTVLKVDRTEAQAVLDYADVEAVKRAAAEYGVTIEDESYGARVTFRCGVPDAEWETFTAALADATSGKASIRKLDADENPGEE